MRLSRASLSLALLSVSLLLVHLFTNHQYGFHRDELGVLDDARYLDWGYVSYPPVTPFLARVASELFGPSLVGLRLFPAVAQAIAVLPSGLIARELGGGRWAQMVAALAVAIAPFSVLMGALFLYVSFEYLLWVALAYTVVRLLRSENPAWWTVIGALIGIGLMTKYTVAVGAAGLAAGLLLTPSRPYLRSRWPWIGAVIALLIVTPNLVWQAQHSFVSLEFLRGIHERDVRLGRTQGYLPEQLFIGASPVTLPLWLGGLWYLLRSPSGAGFRPLGWMYLVPFAIFLVAQGRSYYLAPAYPMLLAAGTVTLEAALNACSCRTALAIRFGVGAALLAGGIVSAALMLPIAPIGSALWNVTAKVHDNFSEQIGWPELVETLAGIYESMTGEERSRAAILTANYGELGAINILGPAYALPEALSGVNTAWYRARQKPAPDLAIVLGYRPEAALSLFESCDVAAIVTNHYAVTNEEFRDHPEVLLCRGLRRPWPETWESLRHFG